MLSPRLTTKPFHLNARDHGHVHHGEPTSSDSSTLIIPLTSQFYFAVGYYDPNRSEPHSMFFPRHILTTPPINTSSGLGDLRKLPNELVDCVLGYIDLGSFMNFRSINDQTHIAASKLPAFKLLCDYTPQTVQAIMGIGTGHWTTCQELLDKICMAYCDYCDDFAGHIYVLGPVQRMCYSCFTTCSAFCPLPPHGLLETPVRRRNVQRAPAGPRGGS